MRIVLEITRYVLVIVIIVLIVLCLVRGRPAEGYRREAFPRGEAHYYTGPNQHGIPRCRYGPYTPILTCVDDKKTDTE
ncbi:hypothetical protein EBZ80_03585 [bacterium]|nr:hypothetical protein [bacterium]